MKTWFMLLCLVYTSLQAQGGIQFFEGTWQQALDKAQQEHKIIFVDAYAVWCGPCIRMAKEVFTLPTVGEFYNKHFINMKIDMEKGEGPQLAQKYQVTAYPTFIFVDGKGQVVNVGRGAQGAEQFIELGRQTLSKNDKSQSFEELYNKGDRSPALLRSYAYALLLASKPHQKIANEFLRTNPDFTQTENLNFIYDFLQDADSKLFEEAIKHREGLIKLRGDSLFRERMRSACNATVKKAAEYNSPKLLQEAKQKMQQAAPAYAKEYQMIADIEYAGAKKDTLQWLKKTDQYLKKYKAQEAEPWLKAAERISAVFPNDKRSYPYGEQWSAKAHQRKPSQRSASVYALYLRRNGKTKEADELEKAYPLQEGKIKN